METIGLSDMQVTMLTAELNKQAQQQNRIDLMVQSFAAARDITVTGTPEFNSEAKTLTFKVEK